MPRCPQFVFAALFVFATQCLSQTCRDVPLRDSLRVAQAQSTLSCQRFLEGNLMGEFFMGKGDIQDCLVLKHRLQSTTATELRQQRHTCACLSGFTDSNSRGGLYQDISAYELLTSVHCATRCGSAYQQIAQAQAYGGCACVNRHGCMFTSRDIPEQIALAQASDFQNAALLVLPDNILLNSELLYCQQSHCSPPSPVDPRTELLCALNEIPFARCDACGPECDREGTKCERINTPPFCRRFCASGHFDSVGVCTACRTCRSDEFEAEACAGSADTVCEPCTLGTFLPPERSNKKKCVPCPAGQYATSNAGRCAWPPAGSQALTAAVSGCADNRPWDAFMQKCADCTAAYFTAGPHEACIECPEHMQTVPGAQSECVACPPSHRRVMGTAECLACPPGSSGVRGGDECVSCADNTVNPGGVWGCVACETNAVANAAQTACQPCPEHQTRAGNGTCQFCEEGWHLTSAGVCEECMRSQWEQCSTPLISDNCRGALHPRASGVACTCSCRACPLRAGSEMSISPECQPACSPGYRMHLHPLECVLNNPSARIRDGLAFLHPTNFSDLREHECYELFIPGSFVASDNALVPCSTGAHSDLSEACALSTSAVCANATQARALGPKSISELAVHNLVAAEYQGHNIQCFFCCAEGFRFEKLPLFPHGHVCVSTATATSALHTYAKTPV